MSETKCVLLARGLDILPGGELRPCCSYEGTINAPELRFPETSGHDALLGEAMADLRRATAAGDKVPGCRRCYRREEGASTSDRQRFGAFWRHDGAGADPYESVFLERLSLHVGSYCNLKCRMCNPRASSQIAVDRVHRRWTGVDADPAARSAAWLDEPERFMDAIGDWTRVRFIQMSGGEPMLHPGVRKVLAILVDRGLASGISLGFPINGTRLPDATASLLVQFKAASVRISIDGLGPANEYIRYPSRWAEIEQTVERLAALGLDLQVGFTLSAYNVFEASRVMRWAERTGLRTSFGVVEQPSFLRPAVLQPHVLREAALDCEKGAVAIFDTWMRAAGMVSGVTPPEVDRTSLLEALWMIGAPQLSIIAARDLYGLADELRRQSTEHAREQVADFKAFTRELDADRGQSIATALPRIAAATGMAVAEL